jgi:hypothetical protein
MLFFKDYLLHFVFDDLAFADAFHSEQLAARGLTHKVYFPELALP